MAESSSCDSGKKQRKTKIVRTYDGSKKYWVDVEVFLNGTFKGAQWPGPDFGNLGQETIQSLDSDLAAQGTDEVEVKMIGLNAPSVKLKAKHCATFATRGANVQRTYNNNNSPDCKVDGKNKREVKQRRIAFNNIDKEHLGPDGNPPSDPKEYKDAVTKSKDQVDLWLDIEVPQKVKMNRGKALTQQKVQNENMWGSSNISLPGSSDKTDPDGPHLRLDPYQVAVNFGPDNLAVEFGPGSGAPAGSEPPGGSGPPPVLPPTVPPAPFPF